jgi:hypothetical protein
MPLQLQMIRKRSVEDLDVNIAEIINAYEVVLQLLPAAS